MKPIAFVLLTVFLSYAPTWAPYYTHLFLGDRVEIKKSVQDLNSECTEVSHGNMNCTDKYLIPIEDITMQNGALPDAVGLGMYLSATSIYSSDRQVIATYGDLRSASKALELLKTYQTVDVRNINLGKGIIIEAWGPKNQTRHGYQGGVIAIGGINEVQQIRRVIEFFTNQYHLIISLLLLFSLFFIKLVVKPYIATTRRKRLFEYYIWAWAGFALIKSGLIEISIPIISQHLFYVRLSNFFSLVAHIGPCILWVGYLLKGSELNHKKLQNILIIICLGMVLSPYYAKGMSVASVVAPMTILITLIKKPRLKYLVYSIFLLIESLKLHNLPMLPYGSLTLTYVTILTLDSFTSQIRKAARINAIMLWLQNSGTPQTWTQIQALVSSLGDQFNIDRITIATPQLGGGCRIRILKKSAEKWNMEEFLREGVPAVFSHVITTRNPIIHVSEDSSFSLNLNKNQSTHTRGLGSHYSVFPLLREGNTIGALSLTGYHANLFENEHNQIQIKMTLEYLMPKITQSIWLNSLALNDSWYKLCADASDEVKAGTEKVKLQDQRTIDTCLENIVTSLSKKLDMSIFIARVNPNTRALDHKHVAGMSNVATNKYMNAGFYALAGNTTGPMPLAVSSARIVTVPDIDWVKPILHPTSKEILNETNCRSAAAIPIILEHPEEMPLDSNSAVWGLLWLESTQTGTFTADSEIGLKLIKQAVESELAHLIYEDKAMSALTDLVRPELARKLIYNESVRENEHGVLLMIDLKGSTKIANRFGADSWNAFIDTLKPAIRQICLECGYSLQLVIWDAFYITKPANSFSDKELNELLKLVSMIEKVCDNIFVAKYPDIILEKNQSRARYCIDHGDTTRDIQNGSWTIVGTCMANVSKLESKCKALAGDIFLPKKLVTFATSYKIFTRVKRRDYDDVVALYREEIDVELSSNVIAILNHTTSTKKVA